MINVPEQRPRPRKRPKQKRSIETVKAIVEAAARILEDKGHAGYSTNAVAERAGVSVGSLYQYFPSKEALIAALLTRETSLLIEDAEKATECASGSAALSDFIAACVSHQFRRPRLARLLDLEEASQPLDAGTRDVSAHIHVIVHRIIDRLDLPRQSDSHLAARDVVAIVKGMVDGEGQYIDADERELASRVERAAFGYLETMRR
ncbi:MAG: TetR/AcrR family transcriptional regulator [Rhodanobacter sp.]